MILQPVSTSDHHTAGELFRVVPGPPVPIVRRSTGAVVAATTVSGRPAFVPGFVLR